MKSILVSLSVILLFSACSGKKYFEPQNTESISLNDSSLSSSIKSFNRAGATLEDNKFITQAGVSDIKLPEGFEFINHTDDGRVIATNYLNKILIGNEERATNDVVVAASQVGEKLAVIYSNNTIELLDMSSNKTLFKEYLPLSLANDTRIANPVFFGNLILFPTLNGRVLIVSSVNNEQVRNVAVDHEHDVNNIIELSIIQDTQTLIVASPNKIVSISPKEILSKSYKLRDVLVENDAIYIATIDGQIIKLNHNLEEVAKKKYKYAKFHTLALGYSSLYALESQGFLVNINKDFTEDKVYNFSFDNEDKVFTSGNNLYYGSKSVVLP